MGWVETLQAMAAKPTELNICTRRGRSFVPLNGKAVERGWSHAEPNEDRDLAAHVAEGRLDSSGELKRHLSWMKGGA